MARNLDPSRLADGAVSERLELEMQRVLENVADPNTPWKKKRKIQLTITIDPNEKRELAAVTIDAKTTLAPANAIPATIMIGTDGAGKIVGKELLSGEPGQTYMDNEGRHRSDVGEEIKPESPEAEKKGNVVGFK